MKQYFQKQMEFERWANGLVLDALRQAAAPDPRAVLLFSHLLSSSSMWLSRLKAEPFTTTIFQERTIDECEQLSAQNTEAWQQYLADITPEELERVVHFIFPIDGSKKKMRVDDAITHIITHSAYHRGQIIARLKGAVEPLPLTTYIVFASESDEG